MAQKRSPSTGVLDTRRANLRALIKKWGGPGSLAKKLGLSSGSYISQLAGPNPVRDVSEDVARDIERKLDLPVGWLDREEGAPTVDVNMPLIADVIRIVTACTAESRHTVEPAKLAEVVSLAYERAAVSGAVDEGYVKRLLKLTR